jgi:hypothetical protein
MKSKAIWPGLRINPPDNGANNCLSLTYTARIVAVCNAVLNLRLKNGKALISDQNLLLELDAALAGGSAGGTIQTMRVKSVAANHLVCRSFTSGLEGAVDILVARPFAARQPAAETIAGTTYTYTYSAGPDALNNVRESNDGSTTEDQIVTPLYVADSFVLAAQTDYTGVANVTYIEISPRCWAKIEPPA